MFDVNKLIAEFEDEIRESCCHMQIIVLDYSAAALKLQALGGECLPDILAHLEATRPTNQSINTAS
jgi:hypothetical protein